MATMDLTHRISVSSSRSVSGKAWTVFVAGESQAIFTGEGAKGRAIERALRAAEDLRASGAVLLVVEPEGGAQSVTRISGRAA